MVLTLLVELLSQIYLEQMGVEVVKLYCNKRTFPHNPEPLKKKHLGDFKIGCRRKADFESWLTQM